MRRRRWDLVVATPEIHLLYQKGTTVAFLKQEQPS